MLDISIILKENKRIKLFPSKLKGKNGLGMLFPAVFDPDSARNFFIGVPIMFLPENLMFKGEKKLRKKEFTRFLPFRHV